MQKTSDAGVHFMRANPKSFCVGFSFWRTMSQKTSVFLWQGLTWNAPRLISKTSSQFIHSCTCHLRIHVSVRWISILDKCYAYVLNTPENCELPLCLKTFIFAPDNLAPSTREEWFSSSLTIKSPFPTRVGMLVELVAKPIPKAIAAGLPINRATRVSISLWRFRVPSGERTFSH